ncbi:MAG: GIY-YIG nuclease family protein [Cyanobacteria bacterium P01_C01_bin.73]
MPDPEQRSFLSYSQQQAARFSGYVNEPRCTGLTALELETWKQRILKFQTQVRQGPTQTQGSLFAAIAADSNSEAEALDPFALSQENIEFWRQSAVDEGVSALYFVIDHTCQIMLYVGETVKSNQRWKGVHDCKRYVSHYLAVHQQLNLKTQVNIGFWRSAPRDRKARQTLERQLIYRWRSPFNKENWNFWGTPFVGQRAPSTEAIPAAARLYNP